VRAWKSAIALLALTALLLLTHACAPANLPTPAPTAVAEPTPGNRWAELILRVPYPYTTPLPPALASAIDGTYAKVHPGEGAPIHCRRCPDYAREPGIWKLNFDKASYRIYYPTTNWASIGSFTLSADRLTLFNDPTCPDDVGVYTWRVQDRQLILHVIRDACAIELRGKNLSDMAWQSCRPPNIEAAISDHWQKPPGCE